MKAITFARKTLATLAVCSGLAAAGSDAIITSSLPTAKTQELLATFPKHVLPRIYASQKEHIENGRYRNGADGPGCYYVALMWHDPKLKPLCMTSSDFEKALKAKFVLTKERQFKVGDLLVYKEEVMQRFPSESFDSLVWTGPWTEVYHTLVVVEEDTDPIVLHKQGPGSREVFLDRLSDVDLGDYQSKTVPMYRYQKKNLGLFVYRRR